MIRKQLENTWKVKGQRNGEEEGMSEWLTEGHGGQNRTDSHYHGVQMTY